jgi:hypothetical protein
MGVMMVAVEEDVEIHVDERYQRKNEIFGQAVVRQDNPRTLATEMSRQVIYLAMLLRKGAINVV